ncbi:RNA methyltransferase [Bacteroidetes/Chlorobi group bacterium Naka2016]|jgi:TrmH family RNA methyltransferase|nr:MAG: RNA methyltransferase [Bacteroidetes/Chlorobi group bacterium Naka2016]
MLVVKFKPISNNLKKFIVSLKDKKQRKETGLFIAEGYKICEELYNSNYPTELIVVEGNAKETTMALARKFFECGVEVYTARRSQFIQLCETETPQDILAVARSEKIEVPIEYPIIVLDGISDPGNFGTIIRTADWFGVRTIVTSQDSVEKYNSKVIRGSMGSFFRINVIQKEDLVDFIQKRVGEAKVFAATPNCKLPLSKIKFPKNSIIIFGNEARGISPNVLQLAETKFKIEGTGRVESLNLAISVGIVLYKYFNEKYET